MLAMRTLPGITIMQVLLASGRLRGNASIAGIVDPLLKEVER